MKKIIFILFLISSSNLLAGSHLPDCQGNDVTQFDNCMISIEYPSGDKYEGEFKDGLYHGQGTYFTANGDTYVGEFKNAKYHGEGTYTFADGRTYVGEFNEDAFHGKGTYTNEFGDQFIGQFTNNSLNGKGTINYANGDKYVGGIKNYLKHGSGAYTDPRVGATLKGKWEDDNMIIDNN